MLKHLTEKQLKEELSAQIALNKQLLEELISLKKDLISSRAEYNKLLHTSRDAIAILDMSLNIKNSNHAFVKLFTKLSGTTINDGLNLVAILDNLPELKSQILYAVQQSLEGVNTPLIVENPTKNAGAYYCYEVTTHLANYDNKKELIFRIRNVTNSQLKHKQQSDIAISSRISAVGEMVSALAHEINQPLAAINAYSRGCLHILTKCPNPRLSLPLEKIAAQAELAGEIIHNMKNFMREGNIYLEETDINQLINDTITILHYELLDSKFKIKVQLINDLPKLSTNKIHIMQVILNLARNSIEALESINASEPQILIQTTLLNEFIQVHIKDNGPGIPKEFKNLVLNTYFTTKHKGTGIGLGICRKLIEEHGGKLSIREHDEQGAWFTFTLPINIR